MSELLNVLRDCCYEAVVLNPGCHLEEFLCTMVDVYPVECVDALGWQENDVKRGLKKMWSEPYTNVKKETHTIEEWSKILTK